ncbi:MAG: hypothetical protein DME57_09785 [Verrucomicrobia bacterium]|nr:MAG: hypothetical protein DME57_09785 [Verrucomicrobiota bacterium]
MDGIGSSKMEWDPSTPDGKPIVEAGFLQAKLKFTGLPSQNDAFGKKKVQLLVDGQSIESATVKVFFPKLATNHPGGVKGNPNWFYYWKEGDVCGIGANDIFDGETDAGRRLGYSLPNTDHDVRLCPLAALSNQGPITYVGAPPWGSVLGCGSGKGIKCVAEILQHERHHIALYDALVGQHVLYGVSDSDGDMIPTTSEGTTDGIASDPDDPDTFNIRASIPDYATYGDNEIRCRKEELKHTVPYHPQKDWADPGCQSTTPYGP